MAVIRRASGRYSPSKRRSRSRNRSKSRSRNRNGSIKLTPSFRLLKLDDKELPKEIGFEGDDEPETRDGGELPPVRGRILKQIYILLLSR